MSSHTFLISCSPSVHYELISMHRQHFTSVLSHPALDWAAWPCPSSPSDPLLLPPVSTLERLRQLDRTGGSMPGKQPHNGLD